MTHTDVISALTTHRNPEKALFLQRFFKTGPGDYAEGDVFWGITVPIQRKVAREFRTLPLSEVKQLLESKVHEHRLTALIILTMQFERGGEREQKAIYDLYLTHTKWINNWDLVDVSCPRIIGGYLLKQGEWSILPKLARSQDLWERRIAMVSTLAFTVKGDPGPALMIAQALLHDTHDLIHKSVGWMLREVGKRCSEKVLTDFLEKHYREMPRTMLRYAIERLSTAQKAHFMAK